MHVRGRGYADLTVPPLYDRISIVRHVSGTLAFPDGERLYQLMRTRYFWPGLKRDCVLVARSSVCAQKERARFKAQPYLFPTEKGAGPLRCWAIDTIVGMQPPHPSGATSIVVAVDMYGKWPEAGMVHPLTSAATAEFLHDNVVCRFGVPDLVRTDRGPEYRG